jgi:DNA (cytosine-5)-methyltransferase 1
MYFIELNADPKITGNARCIHTRQDSGVSGTHNGERTGVLIEDSGTYPCINPDKATVRQGKRIRGDGAPAFCITAQDKHGIIHKGRVRRLCPQEVWRLMGFSDDAFFTAQAAVGSDSKLYKLGGNSIMVPVAADVGRRLREVCEEINLFGNEGSQ